jgi:16S rRNA (guanine527-N7)-methyltransferase
MSGSSEAARRVLEPYVHNIVRPQAEVAADLESFSDLLTRWQKVQNLVSRETPGDFWHRHVADSLQLLAFLKPNDRTFLDLGSGGGFPALPLAIALKGGSAVFHLVEANSRKAAFLRTVARELLLNVKVHAVRIEKLDSEDVGQVDVITSRALAGFSDLLAFALRFWGPDTRALMHKGRGLGDELAKTPVGFSFNMVEHASQTDDSGVIVELTDLRRLS